MATILRGKNKGKRIEISQWCNDWVSSKEPPYIFRITSLEFTLKEFTEIMNHKNNGILLGRFKPDYKRLRFVRRKP